MAWDYDWQAGPVTGSLEDLANYCRFVRIRDEWSGGKRGSNPVAQYRHGEQSSPRKYVRATDFVLETGLRYTDAAGAVTHTDGAAGHAYENFGHLKRLFGGLQGTMTLLQRTAPDQGDVTLEVELLGDALPSQNRLVYGWPLHAPTPFWQGAADVDNSGTTLTVGGDAPAGSVTFQFAAAGVDPQISHSLSGASVKIAGTVPAGGVFVDVDARTCKLITGGGDYSNNLVLTKPWWMELDPGANTVAYSGTGAILTSWVEQWR